MTVELVLEVFGGAFGGQNLDIETDRPQATIHSVKVVDDDV